MLRSFLLRHPGESRGPASGIERAESWVPAFAGMTVIIEFINHPAA
jgi:hypothetical protein